MQHCPVCLFENPADFTFCGQCGSRLSQQAKSVPQAEGGQRRYLTVLFTDLAGYTALCEELDPEEVQGVMSRIFLEIQKIVSAYGGKVSKLLGDSALVIFGFPQTHEDNAVRALRAAIEIHEHVRGLSSLGIGLSRPLRMHTGVNTGLVVIPDAVPETIGQEVAGDAVNVASRLCHLALPGEILIGQMTYRQVVGLFHCYGPCEAAVKGKTTPVRYYKLLSPQEERPPFLSLSIRRAVFVGRQQEMQRLRQAVRYLLKGNPGLVEVFGAAGCGKTRCVQELKMSLNLDEIQWCQGSAYAYRSDIPYYPIIDLLKSLWSIREDDSYSNLKAKIESNCTMLLGEDSPFLPYIGGLFSIGYPQLEKIGPETWRARFIDGFGSLLKALSRRKPLILCLEDIHWADQESLDLVRKTLASADMPVLCVCLYRDDFTPWPEAEIESIARFPVRIDPLPKEDTLSMCCSLLGSREVPNELHHFFEDRIQGNPFYLTEVVNSLIESGLLIETEQGWELIRKMTEDDVPLTVHGLLSARIDRLDPLCRQVLQEASVFGRSFVYPILQKISACGSELDRVLSQLEGHNFIQRNEVSRDKELLFSHALAQEVVYSGLLKKRRRIIHERIAQGIEDLYSDRLQEFAETLAFHYKRAGVLRKAVAYLAKSGEKSLAKHALERAHLQYQEAFQLLKEEAATCPDLIIEVLNQWAFVYYYRGCFKELLDFLSSFEETADSIHNKSLQGMFLAWIGCALWHRERFESAYAYLMRAMAIGKALQDRRLVGYACTWLTWSCTDLGRMSEARDCARIAQEIYHSGAAEFFVFFNSLAGAGYTAWHMGDRPQVESIGQELLRLGEAYSDNRCTVMGHCCLGWGYLTAGDQARATSCFQLAVSLALDPWYALIPKLALCYGLISSGRIDDAELLIQEILQLSRKYGVEFVGTPAQFFHGVAQAGGGRLLQGVRLMQQTLDFWEANQCRLRFVSCSLVLARFYTLLRQRQKKVLPSGIVQKAGLFVVREMLADKKVSDLLKKCIQTAEKIEARGILGQAYLEQGRVYSYQGRKGQALESLNQAVQHLQFCRAEQYLEQARALIREAEGMDRKT